MKTMILLIVVNCFFISFPQDYNWIELNFPPENPTCKPIVNNYDHIFIGGENGIYRTTDEGQHWDTVLSTSKIWSIYNSYDGRMFCCTNNNGIYLSLDSGAVWQQIAQPITFIAVKSIAVSSLNDFIYIAAGNGLHKSSDGGSNWYQILQSAAISVYVDKFNNIFAWYLSSGYYKFHKSTDEGQTWQEFEYISAGGVNDKRFYITSAGYYFLKYSELADQESYILRSSDHGTNWQILYAGHMLQAWYYLHDYSYKDYILWGEGHYHHMLGASSDIRISFNYLMTPYLQLLGNLLSLVQPPFIVEQAFFNNQGRVYAFINEYYPNIDRFFKLLEIPLSIENIVNEPVNNFQLYQNFPNPFNPSTSIMFAIPEDVFVNVKIYDVLGNYITTLVQEELNAGNHTVELNADNLSSGVYYYTMQAGEYISTKKLILLK